MTTILHVEDDLLLAEAVRTAFEVFGFRGTNLMARSVGEARKILADVANHERIDLVISDMQLGDGTGLDVIRYLRSSPGREHIPILVLSGDVDPANVNRAYALGANAYVPKGTFARSIDTVVQTIQEHWLKDVLLPTPSQLGRTREWIAREVSIQTRVANYILGRVEHFGPSLPDTSLYMMLALRGGNVANLLSFLSLQLGDIELPGELLDQIEARQIQIMQVLNTIESTPACTRDEGLHHMLVIASTLETAPFARAVSELFPAAPIAVGALREIAANTLDELAAWILANVGDPDLRAQVARLRAGASELRSPTEDRAPAVMSRQIRR
jgi:CheY-like chemotaxis protein